LSRIVKEWRCAMHGEFENPSGVCPACKNRHHVRQEIRTAPAYRRSGKMAFIDQQSRRIAEESGLSTLSGDPKSGISALEADRRRKQLSAESEAKRRGERIMVPHWAPVPHATPGFSQTHGEVPKVDGAMFGARHAGPAINYSDIPQPRPQFVKRPE